MTINPCPKCQSQAKVCKILRQMLNNLKSFYFVICEKCGHSSPEAHPIEMESINYWNKFNHPELD